MHLYVHIPFCHRICPYCAFFKHTPASTDMKLFIRALGREVESRAAALSTDRGGETATLYFGGERLPCSRTRTWDASWKPWTGSCP
ncbi:hypothetical protein RGQ01_13490 [Akkermansia sp. EB-AMDK43]|uniref:hypothetical protein n=1 Tax=Akkermansia sp. EB-AMDK43 TaxID=3073964 RepID=UPI002868646D|nr:hypothetical protein [Akkermansia sp. EB-AMDK43]WMX38007.1 hypothetical protein RGQ01_13490 [Akkermansia sp. EB-AMDK43]